MLVISHLVLSLSGRVPGVWDLKEMYWKIKCLVEEKRTSLVVRRDKHNVFVKMYV